MRKILLTLLALLSLGGNGAWADGTWGIYSADLTQYGWTAMGENTPSGVTALGSYTPYYRTEAITLTSAASLEVRFKYTAGLHRLEILGVDILDGSSNVIASDYHFGYTGGNKDKNTYLLNAVGAGTYTLRYIINAGLSNSEGNITINTIKYADSYENISQWYVVRVHANQAHYMYYDSSNATTGISFTSSTADINNNNYLWGFVKNGSGVSIYNKAAGNSLAVDNTTPSKMSSDGTSVEFILGTVVEGSYGWGADAFFSIYQTAGTYLNYQGDKLQRWNDADAGSCFMIYAVDAPTNLTATLTDVNGASYTVNYEGFAGMTEPTLTGCYGYTLTNGTWDGSSYAATINFPFPVSSNSKTNYTYIGSFNNKNNYSSKDFLWHSNETNIIVHNGDVPNNTKSESQYTENEKYEWAITPSVSSAGAITFTIKNASTGTYIYSAANSNSHNEGTVTLNATATPVTYINTSTTSTCSPIRAFFMSSTSRYLSVNSVTGGANSLLGAWDGVHDGISVGFYTPIDFATLDANLIAACTAFMPYSNILGSGLGQYSGATSSDMSSAYTTATTTSSLTAAELTSLITTLENPATKLSLNLPKTGGFYKIKGYATNKYAKAGTAGSQIPNSTGETTDGTDIWYYHTDNTLVNYSNGLGTINTHTVASVAQNRETTTFAESSCSAGGAKKIGVYELQSNYSGSKVWYSNTNNVDRNGANNHVNCEWVVTEVTSLPVTISAAGYATLYAPVALTIPDGVTAYTATDMVDYLTLTAIEDDIIPAETGVILKGNEGTYNFEITTGGTASSELQGTVAAIARPVGSYVLARGENGVGFYINNVNTIPGFRAYLPADNGVGVKPFRFGTEDAINAIAADGKAEFFDLSGRQVSKPARGLYIVNGKKVIVK